MEGLTRIAGGLSGNSLGLLIAAARALDEYRGCSTPAENFVWGVLCEYSRVGTRMDLGMVEGDFEEFKRHREEATFIARRYKYLAEESEEAPEAA